MPEWIKNLIESLMPALIGIATQAIDAVLNGESLSPDQLKAVKSAKALAEIWGPEYVASTENTMDDEGLSAFLKLCEDTLSEAENAQ